MLMKTLLLKSVKDFISSRSETISAGFTDMRICPELITRSQNEGWNLILY